MKKLKVVIELTIKGDIDDEDTIREDVYEQLQGLMEDSDLAYEVIDTEEDEDEDESDY